MLPFEMLRGNLIQNDLEFKHFHTFNMFEMCVCALNFALEIVPDFIQSMYSISSPTSD